MYTNSNIMTESLADCPSNENHIHSSPPCPRCPFDILPTEIIEKIFISTCPYISLPGDSRILGPYHPYFPQHEDPLILSMVCKRWQAITITYHSLWATLDICCSREKKKTWVQWGFSRLRNYLSRSGNHPLNIRVGIGKDQGVIWGILNLVVQHSKRWKDVRLEFPLGHKFLRRLDSLVGQLPLLESIYFCLSDTQLPAPRKSMKGGKFLGASLLKRIEFVDSLIPQSVLQYIAWQNIHEVAFKFSTFQNEREFLQILELLSVSTTALEIICASFRSSDAELSIFRNQKPVRLENLRKLSMIGFHGLLDAFVCPFLEHLEIQNEDEDEHGDEDEIARFLKNSSCTLIHIQLCDIQPSSAEPRKYYRIFQNISLLRLKSISLKELTDSILGLLAFDSHELFPLLEGLHLNVTLRLKSDGIQSIISQIEGLQTILESRTQATHPNNDRSLASVYMMKTRRAELLTTLKYCYFTFKLETDRPRWDDDVCLAETMLEDLRLFCISRDIKIQQEFFLKFAFPITSD